MCGIAGIVGEPGRTSIDEAALVQATLRLQHRGPDAARTWSEPGIGLAHTRLAIIDRADGDQPMFSADNRYSVVFNGEIYNHRNLRTELEARGYALKTRCDTEVLLYLYDWLGSEMVTRLRGMFAFCIVDREQGVALVARDRFGKKPLYYAERDGALFFASTLDALGVLLPDAAQLDPGALSRYLVLQYVPSPLTPYRDILKLAPGHVGVWSRGSTMVVTPYWQPPQRAADAGRGFVPHAASQVRAQIGEAVTLRLESEVPLGVFLSGGLDSSIVVAELSRNGSPPATFSMGFRLDAFDETRYAEAVAQRFGTKHTRLVADDDVEGLFRDFTTFYDEPFADSSALATLAVAKAASAYVTVVLTGDGGDEIFGGYARYGVYRRAYRLNSALGPIADAGGRVFEAAGRRLGIGRAETAGRLLREPWSGYRDTLLHFHPREVCGLLRPEFLAEVSPARALEHLDELWRRTPGPPSSLQWVDQLTYLPDDLLTKMDRATMAFSMEARSPFLDHVLADWAAELPDAMLFKGSQGKAILRAAYSDILPPEILSRRKMGFGVPIGAWMRRELRLQVEELLLSGDGPLWPFLRRDVVTSLVTQFLRGGRIPERKIWNLLALAGWMRTRSLG